jgi:RecT family protein
LITNQLFQTKPPLAGHLETVIAVCEKYNLNPMLRELYVRHGEGQDIYPTLTVDGWYNLVNSHPECNGFEFVENGEMVQVPINPFEPERHRPEAYSSIGCKIYRKGREFAPIIYEYLYEVFNPNNPVYYTHPNRLLRHRSFIQAARVVFSLSGIYDSEEVEQILSGKNGGETSINHENFAPVTTPVEAESEDLDFVVIKPGEANNQLTSEDKETQKEQAHSESSEPPVNTKDAQTCAESLAESELDDATKHQITLRLKHAANSNQLEQCIKLLTGKSPENAKHIEQIAEQFAV